MNTISKLQYVTPQPYGEEFFADLEKALDGGIDWVQLRMKDLTYNEMTFIGIRVRELCNKKGATFIVNDHVDLAAMLGADGVHLGLNDMPVSRARKLLGAGKIIGGTANTYHDLKIHFNDGADYVGVGPLRFTDTKKNLSPVLGLEGYRKIVTYCNADQIAIPIIAIGGIVPEDVRPLISEGVFGIALSSAIAQSADIAATAQNFKKLVLGASAGNVLENYEKG